MGLLEDPNLAKATFFVLPWKGYHSQEELDKFIREISSNAKNVSQKCLLALPYSLLEDQSALVSDSFILGCSAMSSATPGSFTESIAAKVLKQKNVRFVLVGSAENRNQRNETNDTIHYKIKKALDNDITPFFCMGESLQEMQDGKRVEILKSQCQEALTGLTLKEIARIAFVYEAPWVQKTAELISMDRLIGLYFSYRQVVAEVVGPKVFPKIRFIDPFPNDMENYSELLLAMRGKGLFISEPNLYTSLLDSLQSLEDFKYPAEDMEPFSEEGLDEEPAAIIENVDEEKNAVFETTVQKATQPSVPTSVIPSSLEETDFADALEKQPIMEVPPVDHYVDSLVIPPEKSKENVTESEEKNLQEPAECISVKVSPVAGEVLTEVLLEEVLEEILPLDEKAEEISSEEELTYIAEEVLVESAEEISPLDKKVLEEPFIPIANEQETALVSLEQSPQDIESFQDQNVEEKGSELDEKLKELNDLNLTLADCYKEITKKSELLPKLRNAFPEKLTKMTADLNQLDPLLQDEINRGNVAFFNQNPEKAKEAGGVLIQLQELNFLLQESSAIPRDVDRLISKGRQIRKQLDEAWAYFTKNRKEIKDAHPDFVFPPTPSQLSAKEPVVDLMPKVTGPSPLVGKRVAVVRTPPLKK